MLAAGEAVKVVSERAGDEFSTVGALVSHVLTAIDGVAEATGSVA